MGPVASQSGGWIKGSSGVGAPGDPARSCLDPLRRAKTDVHVVIHRPRRARRGQRVVWRRCPGADRAAAVSGKDRHRPSESCSTHRATGSPRPRREGQYPRFAGALPPAPAGTPLEAASPGLLDVLVGVDAGLWPRRWPDRGPAGLRRSSHPRGNEKNRARRSAGTPLKPVPVLGRSAPSSDETAIEELRPDGRRTRQPGTRQLRTFGTKVSATSSIMRASPRRREWKREEPFSCWIESPCLRALLHLAHQ